MAQGLKMSKLGKRDALFVISQKCGEWPYWFATVVASAKIMLDITGIDRPAFNSIKRAKKFNKIS